MSLSLIFIVLIAAFLHAFWNALVKGSGDKTIVLGLIALGHMVPGIAIAALAPLPQARVSDAPRSNTRRRIKP